MKLTVVGSNLPELQLYGQSVQIETMEEDLTYQYIRVSSANKGNRLCDISHPIVEFHFEADKQTTIYITGFVVIGNTYQKIHLALE